MVFMADLHLPCMAQPLLWLLSPATEFRTAHMHERVHFKSRYFSLEKVKIIGYKCCPDIGKLSTMHTWKTFYLAVAKFRDSGVTLFWWCKIQISPLCDDTTELPYCSIHADHWHLLRDYCWCLL